MNSKENLSRDLMSLTSLRSTTDDYWHRVLALCHQGNPAHFGLEFPSLAKFTNFEYLDSGTYSHVIKANDLELDEQIVFKIIKVLQGFTATRLTDISLKGFELYQEVFQEVIIVQLLSNLHLTVCDAAGHEYQTHSFPRIFRTRIVHGEIPNYFFIRKYDDSIDKVKAVERFDDVFGVPQEHLVMQMKFGGNPLWDRIQANAKVTINPDQLLSICFQVTFALAVSEAAYEFEHRDLHVCNILVKATKKKHIMYKLHSVEYCVQSFGVKACIIDATFSRVAFASNAYFTNLTSRMKGIASNANPESQEVAYMQMYTLIGEQWHLWFPESNIVWLKYFFNEILTSAAFSSEAEKQDIETLKQLISSISNFKKVADFMLSIFHPPGDRQAADTISRAPPASMSDLDKPAK